MTAKSPYIVDTHTELMSILCCREPDALLSGLSMLIAQIKDTGECMPIFEYARSTDGKVPELFKRWEDFQRDMRPAVVPLLVEAAARTLELLGKHDALLAARMAKEIVKEHMKFVYRALCANQDVLSVHTLNLLKTIATTGRASADALFAAFDFTLNPLVSFCARKKTAVDGQSPRAAFIAFFLSFYGHGGMETKLAAATLHAINSAIIAHMNKDAPPQIEFILDTLQRHVVESRLRNLPLTFFTGPILNQLLKVYAHDKIEVVKSIDDFLARLMTEAMVSPVSKVSVDLSQQAHNPPVKNRITLEFLNHLKPLESVMHQRLAVKILQACPDVFVPYFRHASKSFNFGDIQAGSEETRWIALMGFVIQAAQCPLANFEFSGAGDKISLLHVMGIELMCPSRPVWTRALQHTQPLASYLALSLLNVLLERLYNFTCSLEQKSKNFPDIIVHRDSMLLQAMKLFPDIQLILAQFNQGKHDPKVVSAMKWYFMLFASHSDFSFDVGKLVPKHLRDCAIDARVEMLRLVTALPSVNYFEEEDGWFLQAVELKNQEAASRMLASTGFIADHDAWAAAVIEGKLDACKLNRTMNSAELIMPASDFILQQHFPNTKPPQNDVQEAEQVPDIDLAAGVFFDFATNADASPLMIASELLGRVDRELVQTKLVHTPWQHLSLLPNHLAAERFDEVLYGEHDPAAWLSIIASILAIDSLTENELFKLVESNLLGAVVMGLSTSHHMLSRSLLGQFIRCLEWCHMKERHQLGTLLHTTLRTSSGQLLRVQCMFVASALPIMLLPADPLYIPLNQYLLSNYTLPALPFFEEAFGIALLPSLLQADDLRRELRFVLRILRYGHRREDAAVFKHTLVHVQALVMEKANAKWNEQVVQEAQAFLSLFGQ